jgi:hypothetical protein
MTEPKPSAEDDATTTTTTTEEEPEDPTLIRAHDVFIISSAICPGRAPLSYTTVRSAFSTADRFEQTMATIASVRKHVPGAYVILVDATRLPPAWKTVLDACTDLFVHLVDDEALAKLAVSCPHKAVPECMSVLRCLELVRDRAAPTVKNVFKISGRYKLTPSFEHWAFDGNDKVVFKRIPASCFFYEKKPCWYTFLLKLPASKLDDCIVAYGRAIQACHGGQSLELLLPLEFAPGEVLEVPSLGVEGLVAPTRQHFIEFDWEVYLAAHRDLLLTKVLTPARLEGHFRARAARGERRISTSNRNRVLCISHCYDSGTYAYYDRLARAMPDCLFLYYSFRAQLEACDLARVSVVHVFSLYSLDIDRPYLAHFLSRAHRMGIPIYFTLHDFQWLFPGRPNLPARDVEGARDGSPPDDVATSLLAPWSMARALIAPSEYVREEYLRLTAGHPALHRLVAEKSAAAGNPDFRVADDNLVVPALRWGDALNVAHLGAFLAHKGRPHFLKLAERCRRYAGGEVRYHVFGSTSAEAAASGARSSAGRQLGDAELEAAADITFHGKYDEANVVDQLHRRAIHVLVFLGDWGETYGYAMTLAISSGLPIVYRNIGSFRTRLDPRKHARFFPIQAPAEATTGAVDMDDAADAAAIDSALAAAFAFVRERQGTRSYVPRSALPALPEGCDGPYAAYAADCRSPARWMTTPGGAAAPA